MPLFAQARRFTFKLHGNPLKMARSLKKLLNQVMDLLADNAQVFSINHENITYLRQLTAESGFFLVRVRPPGDWAPVAPVLLAFSLRDLYLTGYQDNTDGGIWKLYSDAYLPGSGADVPANANEWRHLRYAGGYTQQIYGVSIGLEPMYNALQTLNNPDATDMAKRLAPGLFIITIPEAGRFPLFKRHLVDLLRQYQTMILIHDDNRCAISFTDYSSICKRVRKGPARFVPGDGFATYTLLIEFVSVLLSRPPANEL